MVDNWVQHCLSVLNTLSEVPKWCSQQFFFTLSWLISYPKLVHAAKSVTKTHVRGKRHSTPQLHTPVQRVYKQHPAGFRANKMGPCEREAGGRTRWLTGRVGVSSSRQASASSSPATVRALFWSTVPHMRMHMAEDAHTNTHTQMQMRMDTHMSGCRDIHLSIIFGHIHTHTYTLLPLCPSCQKPVK